MTSITHVSSHWHQNYGELSSVQAGKHLYRNSLVSFFLALMFSFFSPVEGAVFSWSEIIENLNKSSTSSSPSCDFKDGTQLAEKMCSKPVEVICDPIKITEKDYEKIKALSEFQLKFSLANEVEKGRYLEHLADFQEKVLNKYHLQDSDLDKMFELVKSTVKKVAANNANLAPESKKEFAKALDEITFSTPNKSLAPHQPKGLNPSEGQWKRECGEDGLQMAAEYSDPSQRFIICPAELLNALINADGDLRSIAFTMAHEIGHAVSPDSNAVKQLKLKDKVGPYRGFLSCIDKSFYNKKAGFNDIDHLISSAKKHLDRVTKLMEKINPNLDAAAFQKLVQQRVGIQKSIINLNNIKAVHPQLRTALELGQDELVADFYGTSAMTELLQDSNDQNKIFSALSGNLNAFCKDLSSSIDERINMGLLDPTHPPRRYRVETAITDPHLQNIFGCHHKSTAQWCTP